MSSTRAIPPNPPRWHPNPDPSSIYVPGLDTSASVLDQIEQMEQLITIKLQNIDENFSKIHNVLANKVLPAVKRYAVGTEPVREAAKFWTSFYEQAAQIRIPTFDDYSSLNEQQSHSDHDETQPVQPSSVPAHSQRLEPSSVSTESSFMPTQAAYSSTPATLNRNHDAQNTGTPSWTTSIESPLVRLDRELRDFNRELESDQSSATEITARKDDSLAVRDQVQTQRADKGKGKQPAEPPPRNALRHTLHSTNDSFTPRHLVSTSISPLKLQSKPKTPVLKNLNPYLPPDVRPAEWSGIVNLADPRFTTPRHPTNIRPSSRRNVASGRMSPSNAAVEDSFEGLPVGMSPPVMMSPARPPRSSAELLGQTPMREAAQRIGQDLLSDIQRKSGGRQVHGDMRKHGVESSLSTVPTPPSLSRYRRRDGRFAVETSESTALSSSVESMMRRLRLEVHGSSSASHANEPATPAVMPPSNPMFNPAFQEQEELDSDSDSFDDEENNTAHPSAAFLMATRAPRRPDDSFDSNHSSDSFSGDEIAEGHPHVHPFAREMIADDFDDSFDDDGFEGSGPTEETLFGVPPNQRLQRGRPVGELRMLGDHLLEDTIGIGSAVESPTPIPWPGSSLG